MSEEPGWRQRVYGRALGGATRSRPSEATKRRIRAEQANRCLYCDLEIGTFVNRRGSYVEMLPRWDHYKPFAYLARSPLDNWVLACHVCNSIKHSKIYDTLAEAREQIRRRRVEIGFEPLSLADAVSGGEGA